MERTRAAELLLRTAETAFDAYLMVDWSGADRPVRGENSIWWALYGWDGERLRRAGTSNPDTRVRAEIEIVARLRELVAAGRSVLVGFDFPFGYPAGFAGLLGLEARAFAVWDDLAAHVVDGDDNRSNRFDVAARMNQRASGGSSPFWGWPSSTCPPPSALSRTKPRERPAGLNELRHVDGRIRGPKSAFQLCGAGCVGSQAMLGLPRLRALLRDPALSPHSSVWPFTTGARLPPRTADARVLYAEIYPSLFDVTPQPGEVKDEAQVRCAARAFAAADAAGDLDALFEAPGRQPVHLVGEEGWILGVR